MAEISVLLSNGLRALYARCRRETGYRQKQLSGDIEALRTVLLSGPSEDFDRLCELRRPDLTVEAFILSLDEKDRFFSSDQLAVARERLATADSIVRSRRIAER